MKKVFILLSISLLSFASCKKCGTCYFEEKTTISPSAPSYPKTREFYQDYCGDDYKEARKFKPTSASAQDGGGNTLTTTISLKRCEDN